MYVDLLIVYLPQLTNPFLLIQICYEAGTKYAPEAAANEEILPSLLTGANIAGFIKVADAMKAHGDWW